MKNARAEAIDEFVARLKANRERRGDLSFTVVSFDTIDKIAKEMKEDDFPHCTLSGCEAARKDCHIGCPYGKEEKE